MSPTRRDFIKSVGAAGLIVAGSDLIGELLAQTPPGRVLANLKTGGLRDVLEHLAAGADAPAGGSTG